MTTEKQKANIISSRLIAQSQQSRIDPSVIEVSKENILSAMEMNLSVADGYLLDLIENLTNQCLPISDLKACYSVISNPEFNNKNTELRLKDQIFSLSKIVGSALKNSARIALFVGTCGEKVEQFSKKLMSEGHSLESLIVDLIASELADGVADKIHKVIEHDAAAEELNITNRYSPGYCNWPVSDQQKLFSLLGDNTCGISLTPSSLMIPIKSVSGIVGIGPEVKFRDYICAKCVIENCVYRNRR